jgi:HSP20 family protein
MEEAAMTLTRWSPVAGLAALEVDHLNRMFDAAFSGEAFGRGAWAPAVDIYETPEKTVVVKVELPEMKREDIKVNFEDHVLTIEGERKLAHESDGGSYHRVERGYGSFRRVFTMPATIDPARIEASYQDGVLTLNLPRREETKPRQIQING